MTLDALAREMLPEERVRGFLDRVDAIRNLVSTFTRRREIPVDLRQLRKELKSLEHVATMLSIDPTGNADALATVAYETWQRRVQLRGSSWSPAEAKAFVAEEICKAIAAARQVHIGRLNPGSSPDGVRLTRDASLLQAVFQHLQIHEADDTVFKRVARVVREARPDAEFEERNPESIADRIRRQFLEGTEDLPF